MSELKPGTPAGGPRVTPDLPTPEEAAAEARRLRTVSSWAGSRSDQERAAATRRVANLFDAYARGDLRPRETDAEYLVLPWGDADCAVVQFQRANYPESRSIDMWEESVTRPHPPDEPHNTLEDALNADKVAPAPPEPKGGWRDPAPRDWEALWDLIQAGGMAPEASAALDALAYILKGAYRRIHALESRLTAGNGTTHWDRIDQLEEDVSRLNTDVYTDDKRVSALESLLEDLRDAVAEHDELLTPMRDRTMGQQRVGGFTADDMREDRRG